MAETEISIDNEFFKSNEIAHGRVVRKLLKELSEKVFNKAQLYSKTYSEITGGSDLSFLYKERNLYSIFASAIDEITPVHLSEWPFNKSNSGDDNSRRVDFWCLNKVGKNGKAINYFVEIKKIGYCLNGIDKEFTSSAEGDIKQLVQQITKLKKIRPNWYGDGDVFLGIIVIHGYHNKNKQPVFDESHVKENIYKILDKRLGAQLLVATWKPDIEVRWENGDKCKFVSIAGIAISKIQSRRVDTFHVPTLKQFSE